MPGLSLAPTEHSRALLLPKPFETPPADARVVHGMAWIAMAEKVLHGTQVRALVGEMVAARVPQRVRVHILQSSALRHRGDQVVNRLAGQRLPALGQEEGPQPQSS
jgi:hypothetical protein